MAIYYPLHCGTGAGEIHFGIFSDLTPAYRINRVVTTCEDATEVRGSAVSVATRVGATALEVEHRETGKVKIIGWKGTARKTPEGKEWKTAGLADNATYREILRGIKQVEAAKAEVDAAFMEG